MRPTCQFPPRPSYPRHRPSPWTQSPPSNSFPVSSTPSLFSNPQYDPQPNVPNFQHSSPNLFLAIMHPWVEAVRGRLCSNLNYAVRGAPLSGRCRINTHFWSVGWCFCWTRLCHNLTPQFGWDTWAYVSSFLYSVFLPLFCVCVARRWHYVLYWG